MFILLFNRIVIISKKNLQEECEKAFELGYKMRESKETNKGFIIGSQGTTIRHNRYG